MQGWAASALYLPFRGDRSRKARSGGAEYGRPHPGSTLSRLADPPLAGRDEARTGLRIRVRERD